MKRILVLVGIPLACLYLFLSLGGWTIALGHQIGLSLVKAGLETPARFVYRSILWTGDPLVS